MGWLRRGPGETESWGTNVWCRRAASSCLSKGRQEAFLSREAWGNGRCVGHRTMRASSGKRTVQAPLRGRTAAVDTATSRRRGRLSRWLPNGRSLHGAKPLRSVG